MQSLFMLDSQLPVKKTDINSCTQTYINLTYKAQLIFCIIQLIANFTSQIAYVTYQHCSCNKIWL